jgi:hypothetical protein
MPIKLRYISGVHPDQGFFSKAAVSWSNGDDPRFTIQILSPAFFSEYSIYPSIVDSVKSESQFDDENKRTVHFSSPELLSTLGNRESLMDRKMASLALLENLRWSLLGWLRYSCTTQAPTHESNRPGVSNHTIGSRFTPPEVLVSSQPSQSGYRRNTTQALIAQKLFFGSIAAVSMIDFMVRFLLISASMLACFDDYIVWKVAIQLSIHVWAFVKG